MGDRSFDKMINEIKYLMNAAEHKYRPLLDEYEDTALPAWIEVLLGNYKALEKKIIRGPFYISRRRTGDGTRENISSDDGINDLVMAMIAIVVIANTHGIYLPRHIEKKIEKMQRRLSQ